MGETTISWTDFTANFWIGCTRQSPGCQRCYAETLAENRMGLDVWGPRNQRQPVKSVWQNVRRWNAAAKRDGVRRRVFCMSMGDFFEPRPEVAQLRMRAWNLIEDCDALDWQILTKHADQIGRFLPLDWGDGWPHVWLGVSVEDQRWADERIPLLLATPAAVRFLSVEPLLGPVNVERWLRGSRNIHLQADVEGMLRRRSFDYLQDADGRTLSRREAEEKLWRLHSEGVKFIPVGGDCDAFDPVEGCPGHRHPSLDWLIVGGESGPGHRPMDPAWAVSIQEQCRAAGVAFFYKQSSAYRSGQGTMPDGSMPREFPRSASVAQVGA